MPSKSIPSSSTSPVALESLHLEWIRGRIESVVTEDRNYSHYGASFRLHMNWKRFLLNYAKNCFCLISLRMAVCSFCDILSFDCCARTRSYPRNILELHSSTTGANMPHNTTICTLVTGAHVIQIVDTFASSHNMAVFHIPSVLTCAQIKPERGGR